jgi:hypothetical protein
MCSRIIRGVHKSRFIGNPLIYLCWRSLKYWHLHVRMVGVWLIEAGDQVLTFYWMVIRFLDGWSNGTHVCLELRDIPPLRRFWRPCGAKRLKPMEMEKREEGDLSTTPWTWIRHFVVIGSIAILPRIWQLRRSPLWIDLTKRFYLYFIQHHPISYNDSWVPILTHYVLRSFRGCYMIMSIYLKVRLKLCESAGFAAMWSPRFG